MNKTRTLFYLISSTAEEKIRKYPDLNVSEFWSDFKHILKPYDNIIFEWKKIENHHCFNRIMNLPEYQINGFENRKLIESFHYLIQQIRIPYRGKGNLRKLIQVALFIGLWNGKPNKKYFYEINYHKTNLDKIETYVSNDVLEMLNDEIDEEDCNEIMRLTLKID